MILRVRIWVGRVSIVVSLYNNVASKSVAKNARVKGRTKMACIACGGNTKGFAKCWKCKAKEEREDAYNLGYQSGFLKGQEISPLQLTRERWEQLRRLCHPDKHNNSRASTEAFQWLQSVEPKP